MRVQLHHYPRITTWVLIGRPEQATTLRRTAEPMMMLLPIWLFSSNDGCLTALPRPDMMIGRSEQVTTLRHAA